eukprot:s626_g9.t1
MRDAPGRTGRSWWSQAVAPERSEEYVTLIVASVYGCDEGSGATPGPNRIHGHVVASEGSQSWGYEEAGCCRCNEWQGKFAPKDKSAAAQSKTDGQGQAKKNKKGRGKGKGKLSKDKGASQKGQGKEETQQAEGSQGRTPSEIDTEANDVKLTFAICARRRHEGCSCHCSRAGRFLTLTFLLTFLGTNVISWNIALLVSTGVTAGLTIAVEGLHWEPRKAGYALHVAFNLLPASGFDDGMSLLSVVLQNRSKKVRLPSTEGTEGAGPILIPLTRLRGNATGASWRNSSYVGELFLGRPQLQRLTVTFDTASGQVILPSSRCRSLACLEHKRYAPRASTSSREINADGSQVRVPAGARTIRRDAITVGVTSIDHGSGRAYGDLIYDRLCFGGVARKAQCANLGFVGVTNMSDAPFRDMLQDGLVGLGLAQLAANPIFHVLSRLDLPSGMARRFGVFLEADGGELSIGGLNPARLRGDPTQLNWAPVHQPEDGYWQFALAGLRIGNRTIFCGRNCRGIVDTSAAGLGLPSSLHATLQSTLGAASCSGPDIYFDVKAADTTPAFSLKLTAKEYRSGDCEAMITATDLPEAFADVLILGQKGRGSAEYLCPTPFVSNTDIAEAPCGRLPWDPPFVKVWPCGLQSLPT